MFASLVVFEGQEINARNEELSMSRRAQYILESPNSKIRKVTASWSRWCFWKIKWNIREIVNFHDFQWFSRSVGFEGFGVGGGQENNARNEELSTSRRAEHIPKFSNSQNSKSYGFPKSAAFSKKSWFSEKSS